MAKSRTRRRGESGGPAQAGIAAPAGVAHETGWLVWALGEDRPDKVGPGGTDLTGTLHRAAHVCLSKALPEVRRAPLRALAPRNAIVLHCAAGGPGWAEALELAVAELIGKLVGALEQAPGSDATYSVVRPPVVLSGQLTVFREGCADGLAGHAESLAGGGLLLDYSKALAPRGLGRAPHPPLARAPEVDDSAPAVGGEQPRRGERGPVSPEGEEKRGEKAAIQLKEVAEVRTDVERQQVATVVRVQKMLDGLAGRKGAAGEENKLARAVYDVAKSAGVQLLCGGRPVDLRWNRGVFEARTTTADRTPFYQGAVFPQLTAKSKLRAKGPDDTPETAVLEVEGVQAPPGREESRGPH